MVDLLRLSSAEPPTATTGESLCRLGTEGSDSQVQCQAISSVRGTSDSGIVFRRAPHGLASQERNPDRHAPERVR